MDILNMITGVDLTLVLELLRMLAQMAQIGPWTAWVIASPFILWVFFLAYMAVKGARKRNRLTGPASWMSKSVEYVGGLFDVFVNIALLTVMFAEFPREWLVTDRLSRWSSEPGKRGGFARWVGRHLLDPFEPEGTHLEYKKQPDGSEPTLQM